MSEPRAKAGRLPLRGILFDKDGTLFDYHRTWVPVNWLCARDLAEGDETLARRLLLLGGHDPESDRVAAGSPLAAGHTAEIAALWGSLLPGQSVEALRLRLDRLFLDGGAESAAAVTDLPSLFRRLKSRGLRLAVATHDSLKGSEAMLRRFGVLELLDFHAAYDSGHGHKPGPGMVEGFCRACGLAAAEIAVVGDNLHDLEMGRSAGAGLVVGVLTGTSAAEDLARRADCVIAGISELEALLFSDQLAAAPLAP